MATKPKDVKRKLDELYWKTDAIRKDLIDLHGLLHQTGFFSEQPVSNPYAPPVVPPQMQQPPVVPPQTYQPPVPPPPVVPPQMQQPPVMPPQPVTPPPPVEKVYEQRKPPVTPVPPQPQPVYNRPAPPPPPPAPKKQKEESPDLEKFIGGRLLTFIGIAVLVTGIAFLVKYAIDKNWINETGRTAIGILCGGVLLGFAHRLRKSFTTFSSVLAGGGIASLYYTITYAFQVYHLFSQPVAFGILVVITGFTVLLSVAYNRKELAILAIVGGFASPVMVKTGSGNFTVLCTYMLILDLGMLALAYFKKWNVVTILTYCFTILVFAGALTNEVRNASDPKYISALVFATLFYLTFFMMNIVNNVRLKNKFSSFDILSLLSNSFLYYGCGYFILYEMHQLDYAGLFTLLVAVFNFGFAFALFRRQEVDRLLVYFLIGLVITFVSLAGPVQLKGNHITLFWAAEGALLYWLYQRSQVRLIRISSVIINFAMLISLMLNWAQVYMQHDAAATAMQVMLNKGFITGICVVISLAVTYFLLGKEKSEISEENWPRESYRSAVSVLAVVLLYCTGFFELVYQLNSMNASTDRVVVYASGYTTLFVLASWFAVRGLKLQHLIAPVSIVAVLLMLAYGYFPHWFTMDLRNKFLLNDDVSKNAFMFHYVIAAAIVGLSVLLYRDLAKSDVTKQLRDVYLWLMCFTIIFIISAELDHTIVLGNFEWKPEYATDNFLAHQQIDALVQKSHKIGFPIVWGICSFIMIFVGMRQQIRQLRIIALTLFFITVLKLISLGIWGETQAGKIAAFIISGVILLLVSFMYQKLKKIILEEDQPTQKTDSHEPTK